MNKARVKCNNEAPTEGWQKLSIGWLEEAPFCLKLRSGNCSTPGNQTKRERTYYVKLVNHLPDYRPACRPIWVCGDSRYGSMDRSGFICGLPRPFCRVP